MSLEQTWRWYGPKDPVTLKDAKMAGATGIVTALHHISNGQVWPENEIEKRKDEIEKEGLTWSVVESIPVHEDIKLRTGEYQTYIENYKNSISNLASQGIDTVCYNFMPVLDWTRTDLSFELPNGSKALKFEMAKYIAFDLFVLKRENAHFDYDLKQVERAKETFEQMDSSELKELERNILAGLPGSEEEYSLSSFKEKLRRYRNINHDTLSNNLTLFLKEIVPVAKKNGVYLAIHPDDPPYSLFGLPRVVSNLNDCRRILESIDSPHNGICFCTGSFGVLKKNDLKEMINQLRNRINFIHLRSTKRNKDGDFYEADHLFGDVNMYEVVESLLEEQNSRITKGLPNSRLPMRPDHGHQMMDDLNKVVNPGYTGIGRLKGLAELRGLMYALENQRR